MDTPITLLTTHHLRGDIEMLPRLFTFIKQLRALDVDDEDDVMLCALQPQARRILLVDLGDYCAPDVWHCAATGGRSMLVALDAMGYDAANVAGQLSPDERAKLADTMQMAIVDEAHRYESNGVIIAPTRQPDPVAFQIVLQSGSAVRLDGRALYPRSLAAAQVGVVHLGFSVGLPHLIAEHVFTLPPDTRPAPTIAGTVDFVLSEARYYQKKTR